MLLKATKGLWLVIAVFALTVALANVDDHHGAEAIVMMMLVLAFPLSLAVMGVLAGIAWTVNAEGGAIPNTAGVTIIVWILLVAAGWLQWFWLMPRVVAHWRTSRQPVSVAPRGE